MTEVAAQRTVREVSVSASGIAFFPEAEGKGVLKVLVVSRKIGQRIHIGDKITVTVVKVGSGGVRLGIEAPPEMSVIREELAEKLRKAEQRILELAKQSPVETDSP